MTLDILREVLENKKIRQITLIEYEIAAEIPLRVAYLDSGGNYHSVGFTNEHKLVTFE